MIKTKRLVLRSFKETDLQDIYEYSKSPSISNYMYFKRSDDVNKIKEYIDKIINEDRTGNKHSHTFAICYNKKVIGEIAILFFEEANEIFWIISEEYQNQGFAYEAALSYLNYIKEKFPVKVIKAHCDIRNIPSKKLIEKLKFTYIHEGERVYPDSRNPSREYSYELIL